VRTGGIDLAAQPNATALCIVEWRDGAAAVVALDQPVTNAGLVSAFEDVEKLGVDVPLGWPQPFVDAITTHSRLRPWPPTSTQDLRFRFTDKVVYQRTGRWPLSVSTDRIGVTAFRAAGVLPPLARDGSDVLVEVYPAASLRCWGFDPRSYKGPKGAANRARLTDAVFQAAPWLDAGSHLQGLVRSDDAFDAFIAALTARATAVGLTAAPPAGLRPVAAVEGWIALPQEGSFSRLAAACVE
jgi:predicted nuclease with RNAse H fold